jgi:hypothetical protein
LQLNSYFPNQLGQQSNDSTFPQPPSYRRTESESLFAAKTVNADLSDASQKPVEYESDLKTLQEIFNQRHTHAEDIQEKLLIRGKLEEI